jgi:hypothetical protein
MAARGQEHVNHCSHTIALILFELISQAGVVFIQISRLTGNKYELVITVYSYLYQLLIWDATHYFSFRCLDVITLYSTAAGNHVKNLVVRTYSNRIGIWKLCAQLKHTMLAADTFVLL